MRYTITGKNIEVTEGLKAAIYEKIGKLERYFSKNTDVIVTLSVEMYVSIDLVEEVIERQLKKYKNKIIDQKQANAAFSDAYIQEEIEDPEEVKIIRSKRFAMKPMDPEEACIQMELLGHAFYVFRNAETDEVNVVYKRKGNTYGLIEPEF